MKKLLSLFICATVSYGCIAQTSLTFCSAVDKAGNCKSKNADFAVSAAGGTITFLLKNAHGLGLKKVAYKIFKVAEDGTEYYNNTILQEVKPAWNFAWQEAVFYDPGTYKIMVYQNSDQGELICTGIIKVFME